MILMLDNQPSLTRKNEIKKQYSGAIIVPITSKAIHLLRKIVPKIKDDEKTLLESEIWKGFKRCYLNTLINKVEQNMHSAFWREYIKSFIITYSEHNTLVFTNVKTNKERYFLKECGGIDI